MSISRRSLPFAIFVLALAVRLLYLLALRKTPFLEHLLLDPRYYDLWAQRLAAGDWLGDEVFYANPLYPYYLGVVYSIFGRHLFLVHLIQHVLGSAGAALLAALGMKLFGRPAGILAGVAAALYAPFVFHEGSLMIESLAPFLGIVALAAMVRAGERRSLAAWLLAGVATGVFVLARPNLTPLAGAAWAVISAARQPAVRRALLAAVFVGGTVLAILPVTARNWAVSGTFVPITAHGGEAYYVGNHPGADGYGTQPDFVDSGPATEHESYRARASQILGRHLTLAESSAYWRGLALQFAREEPGAFLKLLGRKVYLFFHAYERGDNSNYYFMRGEVPYLRFVPLSFGIVAPLAVLGAWVTRREWRRVGIVYLFALTYAMGVVAYFVLSRYRLSVVPSLILLAAAGTAWIWETWRARKMRSLTVAIGAVAALGLFSNLSSRLVTKNDPETTHNNYGLVLEQSGQLDEAARHYEAAANLRPDRALYRFNLAKVERLRGRPDAAIEHLRAAIRLDPRYSDAHAELGLLLQAGGRAEEATLELERAVQIEPGNAVFHFMMARNHELGGRAEAALREYVMANELDPKFVGPALNAAVLLDQLGRTAEAETMYRRALDTQPGAYRENVGLGLFLVRSGRPCEALPLFERARTQAAPAGVEARLDSLILELGRECAGPPGRGAG